MRCHKCGQEIPDQSRFCPNCGVFPENEVQPASKMNKKWLAMSISVAIVAVVIFVIAVLVAVGNKNNKANNPETKTAVTETKEEKENIEKKDSEKEPVEEDPIDVEEFSEVEDISEVEDTREVVEEDDDAITRPVVPEESNNEPAMEPFYGIWFSASKTEPDMQKIAADLVARGYNAKVFLTTDWSNLNREPWYVVTAGVYASKEEAQSALPDIVANVAADAYVKYSGDYIGLAVDRFTFVVTSMDQIKEESDSFTIDGTVYGAQTSRKLTVDSATSFASDCDMEYFANYVAGESVLDWYKYNYKSYQNGDTSNLALLGVFDISVTGDHVDTIYGCYWWD